MTTHGDGVYQYGGQPVGLADPPQGNVWWVDNGSAYANDGNTGRRRNRPKNTIQSAIDASVAAATASRGARIYVMGSPLHGSYLSAGEGTPATADIVTELTGVSLYGIYRENIQLPYNADGLQIIGINRPFITGNDGTSENTGETPTVQFGSYTAAASSRTFGPRNTILRGFHVGGWGDDSDDATPQNRHGAGIAIGQYDDTNGADDVQCVTIEDCTFRQTNGAAAGTNTEDVHTWIKMWGQEKTRIKNCFLFGGEHAIGFMGSGGNQSMFAMVDNCWFIYQTVYTLYSSATPTGNTVRNCVINPSATGEELNLGAGQWGNAIINCAFPRCAETVLTNSAKVSAPSVGTHTGWQLMGCYGQKGLIFEAN